MKTSLFRQSALAGLITTSLFTLNAFAGPGPQYWAQQGKKTAAATPANASAMACPTCKDTSITVFVARPAGGKGVARPQQVGTKHTCDMCGGSITTKDGKTTSDMKGNCPVCAQSTPSCCRAS